MIKKIYICDECLKEQGRGEFFDGRGVEEFAGKIVCGECRTKDGVDRYETRGGRDEKYKTRGERDEK